MKRKVKRISGIFMAATMLLTSNVYGNANTPGPGASSDTEIYAGVLVSPDSVHLNVDVPTRFAFVVRPDTATANAANAPGVLTPNSHVEADGSLGAHGGANLSMVNKSFKQTGGTGNWAGIGVTVQGVIRDNGRAFTYNPRLADTPANPPTSTNQPANTYGMILNSGIQGTAGNIVHRFNAPSQVPKTAAQLDTPIALLAPTITAANVVTPTTLPLTLEVVVGGTNANYNRQVTSSQVGTVSWKVTQTP